MNGSGSKRRAEFGFMMGLSPREPIGRFAQLARLAESVGFDMAWMADSQLYTKDPWVALTLAAAATKTIRLGPGVTNPVTRHFTVTTCTAAALTEVSAGRCVLGFGSGDAAVFPLGLKAKVDDVREAIMRIRTLSEGGAVDVDGRSNPRGDRRHAGPDLRGRQPAADAAPRRRAGRWRDRNGCGTARADAMAARSRRRRAPPRRAAPSTTYSSISGSRFPCRTTARRRSTTYARGLRARPAGFRIGASCRLRCSHSPRISATPPKATTLPATCRAPASRSL